MPTQVQLRRGTAAQTAQFTGAVGELTYSTDDKQVHVHDGETPGGSPLKSTPMVGSTGAAAGEGGTVPSPGADAQGRFLRGDGTWAPGAVTGLTYNGSGQLTGYTEDGIAYSLAYSSDGTLNTITGGGSTGTVSYASGAPTGISYT